MPLTINNCRIYFLILSFFHCKTVCHWKGKNLKCTFILKNTHSVKYYFLWFFEHLRMKHTARKDIKTFTTPFSFLQAVSNLFKLQLPVTWTAMFSTNISSEPKFQTSLKLQAALVGQLLNQRHILHSKEVSSRGGFWNKPRKT